jgi:uncharacterized protein (TIGR02594 family)
MPDPSLFSLDTPLLTPPAGLTMPSTADCPLDVAMREMGTKEKSGARDNPEVVKYLKSCDARFVESAAKLENDETDWCSAFVNWCLAEVGITGTKHPRARSWIRWGLGTRLGTLRFGAIVVLTRTSDKSLGPTGKGHVGFLWERIGSELFLLGGNQNNRVKIKPYKESNLLCYMWPIQMPALPRLKQFPAGHLTPPSKVII